MPASTSWATSSRRAAQSATITPAAVSSEPRVVRTARVTPIFASIDASRLNRLLGEPEFARGAAEAAGLGDRQKHLERG